MREETSCSDEKWQIRSKQIYFCFELYVRQWTLHRCVYGCMSGNSTDFISKYGRLQRIILLKWRGKRTSQTEKCLEGTCIIFLRVTGGKTLRQPCCFPVAILLVEEFQGEFWLVARNSIHVNREWPLADRSPFQRRSQKNFCAEQQSSYGARSLLLACIIFLWIAEKKAQAFDSECFATFPYPTALSQNSNFGRKREDKSFYKRLVFCFDCLAQSPQSLF